MEQTCFSRHFISFVHSERYSWPKARLIRLLFQIISAQSVSAESVKTLGPFVPGIWSQLFKHCECQEEGTRNVVAECLGKLCLIEPEKLLGELRKALTAPSALLRTTVVTGKSDIYRFSITLGNFSCSCLMSGRQWQRRSD